MTQIANSATTFAERIKRKRKAKDLSQFDLAVNLQISYAVIQKAERGGNLSDKFKAIFEKWLKS